MSCTKPYDKGYLESGNVYTVGQETTQWSWLIKTEVNGDTLWTKIINSPQFFLRSLTIEQTNDGGILIGGRAYFDESIGLPYLMKLTPCGEKQWCKIFETNQENSGIQDISETISGRIILLVNQYGESSQETMHLFKLNSFGEVLWKKPYCNGFVYPESANPLGESVLVAYDNSYLVSGNVYWEDPWNPGGAKVIRPLFVMVDSIGNEDWILAFGVQETIYGDAFDAIELSNGQFLGVGSEWPETGKKGLFIAFNSNGDIVNYNTIDLSNIDPLYQDGIFINIKKSNSLFITGGGLGDLNQGLKGGEIVFGDNIFDPDFSVLYHRYDQEASAPYIMDKTTDNKLISNSTKQEPENWDIKFAKLNMQLEYDTAYPNNYTYDSLCLPAPPQSRFIFLDTCDIITGVEIPAPEEYYARLRTINVTAYPNPVKDKVTFSLENTEHHKNIKLNCFSLMGKQVYETSVVTGQKEVGADVNNWPVGMYLVVVYSDGIGVGRCKFVVCSVYAALPLCPGWKT